MSLRKKIEELMDFAPSCEGPLPGMTRGGSYLLKADVLALLAAQEQGCSDRVDAIEMARAAYEGGSTAVSLVAQLLGHAPCAVCGYHTKHCRCDKTKEPVSEPRLYSPYGHWHHGNGVLCAGTLRIAREDFDSNPADKVKKDIFDWMCSALNTSPAARRDKNIESERERFEAWAKIRNFSLDPHPQNPQLYRQRSADGAWAAWIYLTRASLSASTLRVQAGDAIAWCWSEDEGKHWFSWTTDWEHHDKAVKIGCPIKYAYPQQTCGNCGKPSEVNYCDVCKEARLKDLDELAAEAQRLGL